jgi:hypothetical protein
MRTCTPFSKLALAAHTLHGIAVHSGKLGLRNKEVSHGVAEGWMLYSLVAFGASGSFSGNPNDRN